VSKKYHQFCGVAKALDVVGERWTLLLVRDLLLGPRRYGDLLAGLPGLTTNLLAERLAFMTSHGLIRKLKLPPPSGATVYELSDLGRELEPVVLALGRFGARWLTTPDQGDVMNPRWAMVSLKRRFRPRATLKGTFELKIGDLAFQIRVDPNGVDVRDGAPPSADAGLLGDLGDWFLLLSGRETLSALLRQGRLSRRGSARLLNQFVRAIGARP
jgi:DNA-binding HxlR family transcriptional regulator